MVTSEQTEFTGKAWGKGLPDHARKGWLKSSWAGLHNRADTSFGKPLWNEAALTIFRPLEIQIPGEGAWLG